LHLYYDECCFWAKAPRTFKPFGWLLQKQKQVEKSNQTYPKCLYIYIFSFHWILLVICVESSKLVVFDSKRRPQSDIQYIIDPLNKVSLICTIESFSFFDQLNNKHIFKHWVWKKFVKKYKGRGEWKDQLTVRMDFPVYGVATILHISFGVLYTHTQILYT
jgi:hypothetical protein